VLLTAHEAAIDCINIGKDKGTSAILGHAGFIKTVKDLYEPIAGSAWS
jgi:adenosine/AMP kinase